MEPSRRLRRESLLAQRMSQTMFATNHNKMLFVWSFMAPTSSELAAMPANSIILGDSQPIELQPAFNVTR